MSTAVVILNYNNSEDTINCIKSVEENNTADVKYVVVDNGLIEINKDIISLSKNLSKLNSLIKE